MNGKPVTGRHTCTHSLDLCLVFQDIDKFGNEITQLARPLPVEYLIIDVSVCHLPLEVRTAWGGLARVAA